ncbi:hypothetical protein H2248_001471 [Termitomyces sp. 'cryptogamus']|nr:hypothetical protein H2248_001471 [Termitomyces sp. 'cryptogamus']
MKSILMISLSLFAILHIPSASAAPMNSAASLEKSAVDKAISYIKGLMRTSTLPASTAATLRIKPRERSSKHSIISLSIGSGKRIRKFLITVAL